MCTVTLSYNDKDKMANEQLAALLSTGLFAQLNVQDDLDIDYSDSSLYEECDMPLHLDKDSYTPEELRSMLMEDLEMIYKGRT